MGKYISAQDVTLHKFKRKKSKRKNPNKETLKLAAKEVQSELNVPDTTLRTYSYAKIDTGSPHTVTTEVCNTAVLKCDNFVGPSDDDDLGNYDVYFTILDEIALEGLDGITIEALWKRVAMTFKKTMEVKSGFQEYLWDIICTLDCVEFYELPEPRGELFIYNRYDFIKEDDGLCLELSNSFTNIYPYHPINGEDGIQGSSQHYVMRIKLDDEIRKLSLYEVTQRFGNKLVIVASQKRRSMAIYNESSDPLDVLNDIEYCLLEIVGRSRHLGEMTRGNMSLHSVIQDSRSLFHYEKNLISVLHVAKQRFYVRSFETDTVKQGRLLHLRRFYKEFKSKYLSLAEQIVNYMRTKPNYRIKYSDLRTIFSPAMMLSVGKLIKSSDFRNFVDTDVSVKWRDIYPNATVREWKCLANQKEKTIRTLNLKNPKANLAATWNRGDDSDNEEQAEEFKGGHKIINSEALREVYGFLVSRGDEGATNQELMDHCEIEIYTLRLIVRKLQSKQLISISKEDIGKLRIMRFMAKHSGGNLTPPAPPARVPSILQRIKARQIQALQKATPDKIYTLEQAEMDKINLDIDVFPFIRSLEIPLTVKIRNNRKIQVIDEKMDVDLVTKFWYSGKQYKLALNYKQWVNINKPKINDFIKPLNFKVPTLSNTKIDLQEVKKIDKVTKLFQLQLLLKNIEKNKSAEFYLECINESISGNKSFKQLIGENVVPPSPKKVITPVIPRYLNNETAKKLKLNYMGLNPPIICEEIDNKIRVVVEMSTPPPAVVIDNSVYMAKQEETERMKSRIKIILDAVKKEKIIEDPHKLWKVIEIQETKEGYDKKVDRKSVLRIFKKLVDEGYVKFYRLIMSAEGLEKSQMFLCDYEVPPNHHIITACRNQFKLKYFMTYNKKRAAPEPPPAPPPKKRTEVLAAFSSDDVRASIAEFNRSNEKENSKLGCSYDRYIGKTYGFRPKFVRMQVLHEFLHYLLYFSTAGKPLGREKVEQLFQTYKIALTSQDLEALPALYVEEISWKSFIHPLPAHKGWDVGWSLMADVVLNIPLSIFVKLHSINFSDPDLIDFLQHPVRRHFLVSSLPQRMKNILFFKRKYLMDIHENLCLLAYAGLLQFGPQKAKEKDQVFIYLNKKASLYDTTTSESGYNKVTEKEYPKLDFVFNSQNDLDSYWYNLWSICMNTKLGARNVMLGKSVMYLDVSVKSELNKTLKPQTNESVLLLDNGELPGDRRGAAGLDSNLWPHITRNWQWLSKQKKNDSMTDLNILKREKFDSVLHQSMPFSQLRLNVSKQTSAKTSKYRPVPRKCNGPLRPSKSTSRIEKKFISRAKKPVISDPLDKILQKKMGNFRVSWDVNEDNILYINKAVLLFLCRKYPKKNYIPFTVQRDVLHIIYPKSKNKSSASVKRRMMMLTKIDPIYRSMEVNYLNLVKIKPIEHYFKQMAYDLGKHGLINYTEKEVICAYIFLMCYLCKKVDEVKAILLGTSTNFTMDRLKEIEDNFVYFEDMNETIGYKEPDDSETLRKELVKNIIHSNLGCQGYHPSWAYLLFRTYQKYSDNTLHNAVNDLKRNQLISVKPSKFKKQEKKKRWNQPFQLSSYYVFMQGCTYGVPTVQETFNSFRLAQNKKTPLDFSLPVLETKIYGQMLCYNEIFTFWKDTRLLFNIPEHSLILDPNIQDHSELIDELAVRQQIKMKRVVEAQKGDQDSSRKPLRLNETVKPAVAPKRPESPLEDPDLIQDAETITRLRSWLTDCMERDRSPSPEFLQTEGLDLTIHSRYIDENESRKQLEREEEEEEIYEDPLDEVPSIEEIKRAMMDNSSNRPFNIPHITELSSLLHKDSFPDRDIDEESVEKLKLHFIPQYPQIVDVTVSEMQEFRNHYAVDFLNSRQKNETIWKNLRTRVLIREPKMIDLREQFEDLGGTPVDWAFVEDIIAFIYSKDVYGVSGPELTGAFPHCEHFDLAFLINFLLDQQVILRCGVCTVKLVHHNYKHAWSMDSFNLTLDDQQLIEKSKEVFKQQKEAIESQIKPASEFKVLVMPWVKVDGTFNVAVLKKWLCCVLSYCLDFPKTSLKSILTKYSYVRPVDLMWLLDLLEKIGCLEMYLYNSIDEMGMFTDSIITGTRRATILDNSEEIHISVYPLAMITLGSFFNVLE